MCVLHIVDRVLGGLLHSEIQIEFEVGVCLSGVEEEACCIQRNLVQQCDQCDCLAAALGEFYHFSVTHQHYHLHQNHIQTACICAQCRQRRFQAGHIAVVVGTQNVDCLVEFPHHQLIIVVCDIRHDIGRDSVGTNQHEILVCAEVGRLEPNCALLLIGVATLGQLFYHPLYLTVLVQGALTEPVIIDNAVFFQITLQTGDVLRQCKRHQRIPSGLRIAVYVLVAVFCDKVLRMLCDVGAMVGILRHLHRRVKVLEIAHFQRSGELLDLVAGIIDVELTLYLPASPAENLRQAVAQRTASGIAHVHRAGGVCGNKFHQRTLTGAGLCFAVGVLFCQDGFHNLGKPFRLQEKVQKAGAGDFRTVKDRAMQGDRLQNQFGNFARCHSECLGAHHCHIGCEIAVGLIRRNFHTKCRKRNSRHFFLCHHSSQSLHQQFVQLVCCLSDTIRHFSIHSFLCSINRRKFFSSISRIRFVSTPVQWYFPTGTPSSYQWYMP